jgi:MarR-like DNA-binding transcriptional regulator SgrR of sgrS sRNA
MTQLAEGRGHSLTLIRQLEALVQNAANQLAHSHHFSEAPQLDC